MKRFHRKLVPFLTVAVLLTLGAPGPSSAAGAPRLTASLVARAQTEPAELVRQTGNASVSRVRGMRSVYRVSVAGAFPPRALRYSVLADGARVGYGAPAADARSVVAVTTDPAVLACRSR